MRQSFFCACAVLIGLLATNANAAEAPLVIDLWPAAAPGEPSGVGEETSLVGKPEEKGTVTRVGNVTKPTLSIFRPAADKANGTSVVICPGGGYNILAWDLEGTEIAEWLNSVGRDRHRAKVPRPPPTERPQGGGATRLLAPGCPAGDAPRTEQSR